LIASLQGAQLRANHAEDVFQVVGKVTECSQSGTTVPFKAEVADDRLIEKIYRGYIDAVSIQVDSDDVECSKCLKPSRKDGLLVHLCSGAWEVVHKPRVRELSIVASPAYRDTVFKPMGFAAAMNYSQLPKGNDGGTIPKREQGPDKKQLQAQAKGEITMDANQGSSAQKADGSDTVVNTTSDVGSANPVDYQQMMDQLTKLENQINANPSASDSEIDSMKSKIAELESEVAKRANKKTMAKKLADLKKKLSESADESIGASEDACKKGSEDSQDAPEDATEDAAKKAKATGKGLIADELSQTRGSNDFAPWFKELIKADRKLVGIQ
jgi:hypothetical protein